MCADLLWAMNTHSGCLGFQSHSYDGPECPVKLRGHPAEPQAFPRDSLHKGTLEGDVAIFLLQFPLLHLSKARLRKSGTGQTDTSWACQWA